MGEKKNNKKENPEELNAYDIKISQINHSVSKLTEFTYELKESINQFNKASLSHSNVLKRLTWALIGLTIILVVLAGIQVYLLTADKREIKDFPKLPSATSSADVISLPPLTPVPPEYLLTPLCLFPPRLHYPLN